MTPRDFFNEYVLPAIEDWRQESTSVRKVVTAISQLDIMADQMIVHDNPGLGAEELRKHVSAARNAAEASFPLRLVIRDVHDTHKHGPLARRNATITRGQRPQVTYFGSAFQPGAFQSDAFQIGYPVLLIVLDDGTSLLADDVIDQAVAYWVRELAARGL
jgi:hypothetical protein